ncbi:MAG: phenylalanine--tRNA ligase subunit alpha [Chlamydiia bacterium]|nr:phenylalanine--tRNA ligase subunit alpha [Chlamydiia bacterium]
MKLEQAIAKIKKQAENELSSVGLAKDIEVLKVKYLGKKGLVGDLMPLLKTATPEERPVFGKLINDLKLFLTSCFNNILNDLSLKERNVQLENEAIDVTLPGRRSSFGRKHVTLRLLEEATEILRGMGFTVQYGPEIESEYYNYDALNFPKDHPAKDMQDTFYITTDTLLRTHTSNTQVRVMETSRPPIRIIAPGVCFRNEDVSARSHVTFHQVEGLYIDKNVTFTDLIGTLKNFFKRLFCRDLKMRFRPSYFPFVEPGMEVDIHCIVCEGKGCSVCKQTGWLEVSGAGMVHPEVLRSGGVDPEEYTGYAWGFGIERLAMLQYGIKDIRQFFENRVGFLSQF